MKLIFCEKKVPIATKLETKRDTDRYTVLQQYSTVLYVQEVLPHLV